MIVSVRELKNHLSEYLRRVQDGEELLITSRGKPVGRLVPARRAARDPEQQAVKRLRALPFVRPGRGGKPRGARKPIPWTPGDQLLSDVLLEDRE